MKEAILVINGFRFEIECDRPSIMLVEEPAYNGLVVCDTKWLPLNTNKLNIKEQSTECLLTMGVDNYTLYNVKIANNLIIFDRATLK